MAREEDLLDVADIAFLNTVPRTVMRFPQQEMLARGAAENASIARLQRRGMIRCQIDTEHSDKHAVMAHLELTDAGRALLDKVRS